MTKTHIGLTWIVLVSIYCDHAVSSDIDFHLKNRITKDLSILSESLISSVHDFGVANVTDAVKTNITINGTNGCLSVPYDSWFSGKNKDGHSEFIVGALKFVIPSEKMVEAERSSQGMTKGAAARQISFTTPQKVNEEKEYETILKRLNMIIRLQLDMMLINEIGDILIYATHLHDKGQESKAFELAGIILKRYGYHGAKEAVYNRIMTLKYMQAFFEFRNDLNWAKFSRTVDKLLSFHEKREYTYKEWFLQPAIKILSRRLKERLKPPPPINQRDFSLSRQDLVIARELANEKCYPAEWDTKQQIETLYKNSNYVFHNWLLIHKFHRNNKLNQDTLSRLKKRHEFCKYYIGKSMIEIINGGIDSFPLLLSLIGDTYLTESINLKNSFVFSQNIGYFKKLPAEIMYKQMDMRPMSRGEFAREMIKMAIDRDNIYNNIRYKYNWLPDEIIYKDGKDFYIKNKGKNIREIMKYIQIQKHSSAGYADDFLQQLDEIDKSLRNPDKNKSKE